MLDLDFDDDVENVGGRMAGGQPRKPISLQNKKVINKQELFASNLIPNPANEKVTYTSVLENGATGILELKNTFGKNIAVYNLYEGFNKIEIPLTNIKDGIYFYCIMVDGDRRENGKLIIAH